MQPAAFESKTNNIKYSEFVILHAVGGGKG